MSFAWPWALLLLPLVLIFSLRARQDVSPGDALDHPALYQLAQTSQPVHQSRFQAAVVLISGLLLVLALTRPQWLGEPVPLEQSGRALYLSIDLSESMLEQDMRWNGQAVSRYDAVQSVVGEFVVQRQGDFIGLVVFGSFADVQAPLTPDLDAVQALLSDLRPGMAESRTAIGDGLALAVRQLRKSDAPERMIVLLSDGENNSGEVTPEDAARIAAQSDIRVYTIGFGSAGGNGLFQSFGLRSSVIDERTLQSIAQQTGGQYYRATNAAELKSVFDDIDRLEPSQQNPDIRRKVTELYWLPLFVALLLPFVPRFAMAVRKHNT